MVTPYDSQLRGAAGQPSEDGRRDEQRLAAQPSITSARFRFADTANSIA
jgi:hypothetical protein